MAVPTTQELLDKIDEAIYARLTGGAIASYSILGKQVQLCTLDELRRLRAEVAQRHINEQEPTVFLADMENR